MIQLAFVDRHTAYSGVSVAWEPLDDGSGLRIPITSVPDNTNTEFYVGVSFKASVIPTNPYVRDYKDNPYTTGRLIYKDFTVNFNEAGEADIKVIKRSSKDYTKRWSSMLTGSYPLGEPPPLIQGSARVPVSTLDTDMTVEYLFRFVCPILYNIY